MKKTISLLLCMLLCLGLCIPASGAEPDAASGYTVHFEANGGSGRMRDRTGVRGAFLLPECGFTAPEGKEYYAWDICGEEYRPGDVYHVDADTVVTALWKESSGMNVTMRLIGAEKADKDVDLGEEPPYLPNYVTWLPTTSYQLEEGATVYDLWVAATEDAGIRSVGAARNYVETVYAPDSLGGYELSEFTNGFRSGWMYTINGSHPGFGLKEQPLHDGDEVIWHYVNDYSYEVDDWVNDPRYPALGDGSYWNRWLLAPDRFGGKGGGLGGDKIKVTFRLIGAELAEKDVDLGAKESMPDYVTWVSTGKYELKKGATVYDLWTAATEKAGIRSVGASRNYVETVYAPDSLGGYELSEFTNGFRSGWMYTINGSHPGYGLKEQTLRDGDEVVWHYVNDYSYEVEDWFGDPQHPALGDGTYWNRWLLAPDRVGAKGGGLGKDAKPVVKGSTITVKPEVKDGAAEVSLDASVVGKALKNTEKGGSVTVVVDTEGADDVGLALLSDAVQAMADAKAGLRLETENGTAKLDGSAVSELAGTGRDVEVRVMANSDGTTAFDVAAGGRSVSTKIKVELPAGKGQVAVAVKPGAAQEIVKKSVVENGRAYAEIPAGTKIRIIRNEKSFGDVSAGAWYKDAVDFASGHELFQGTDKGFEPNAPMTRAMLATVLYRLEEASAAGASPFADVPNGAWFSDAVTWANANGIVMGTDKGFEPNVNISREQIATMLFRYAKLLGLDTTGRSSLNRFTDGDKTASWASEGMQWAVSVGLFKGDDANALNPKGDATRAEVATLMQRLVGIIVK